MPLKLRKGNGARDYINRREMEAFLAECCFVFGCEGLSSTKEECLQTQIVELRCAIRRTTLLQAGQVRKTSPSDREELELPLYEHREGQFIPTGNYLVA